MNGSCRDRRGIALINPPMPWGCRGREDGVGGGPGGSVQEARLNFRSQRRGVFALGAATSVQEIQSQGWGGQWLCVCGHDPGCQQLPPFIFRYFPPTLPSPALLQGCWGGSHRETPPPTQQPPPCCCSFSLDLYTIVIHLKKKKWGEKRPASDSCRGSHGPVASPAACPVPPPP